MVWPRQAFSLLVAHRSDDLEMLIFNIDIHIFVRHRPDDLII